MMEFITYYFFDIVGVIFAIIAAAIGWRTASDCRTIKRSR